MMRIAFIAILAAGCGGAPESPGPGPVDDASIKQSQAEQKQAAEAEGAAQKK